MNQNDGERWGWAKRWHVLVERQTAEAEASFLVGPNHLTRDKPTKTFFVSVITEEVGKLARTANKLSLIPQGGDSAEWQREGQFRLLTIASLVRRMAELWDKLPDEQTGDWHIGQLDREEGDSG